MRQQGFGALVCAALVFAAAATIAGTAARAADGYDIDTGHSAVVFKVDHLGFSQFLGRFNDVSGSFTIDEKDPANSSVTVAIKAESVDTANERRDQHLRSPDFFNAKQFPTVKFESGTVSKSGDHYEISGKLTMHGVTKNVTIELKRGRTGPDPGGKTRTGFNGEFTIKRGDFGMSYMSEGLGDEIEVMLAIEGVRR